MELRGKRVIVTGGAGFLGRSVVSRLEREGCAAIVVPRSRSCDLVEQSAVRALYAEARPDVVFHLAARVGGIGANQRNPGKYFHDNMQMGLNVVEQARHFGVGKVVIAGTVCAYPKFTPVPFRETDLWNGYPEETNAPYGVAKKALLVMAQAYRAQYGTNAIFLLPVNLYGPRDNFDLEDSHVIPAMIRKFIEAKACGQPEVELWGDGTPTREFLYVDDCARALVLAAQNYDGDEPINLGSGSEISMRDLAHLIITEVGYRGAVRWNTARPNGQPRRCLDTSRAKEWLGFQAEVSLNDGIRRTVEWYAANRTGKV